jgi:cell volume regulation protein A
VRELELPREALVNVIVRDGHAIPPRGSTELREGDELHVLVRGELRDEVEKQTERWVKGPIGRPVPPPLPRRAASQVFSVRPLRAGEDPEAPEEIDGIPVVALLRSRRDDIGAMAALADGRYAVTSADLVAIGGRRSLAGWCEGRAELADVDTETKAWLQEITGALIARGRRL